jgi:hypothetical protein
LIRARCATEAADVKIETNQSAIAYHLIDGPKVFPYANDARHAVSNFPLEWSEVPWTAEEAAAARQAMELRYVRAVEEAKAKGLPVPRDLPPLPTPRPLLDPEDQAAITEHEHAVAEASERLKVAREKAAKKKAEEDQIAADEALVATPPPQPNRPPT